MGYQQIPPFLVRWESEATMVERQRFLSLFSCSQPHPPRWFSFTILPISNELEVIIDSFGFGLYYNYNHHLISILLLEDLERSRCMQPYS